jgi:EAL domain-containing protein (putative c-di-GMP-specific phosphodiesterase class I)
MTINMDKLKIIVIEDSQDGFLLIQNEIINVWQTALIKHADNEETLCQYLKVFEPDLVICNYCTPHLTHAQATSLVEQIRPDTPMILLSGPISDALVLKAMLNGMRERGIHSARQHREKLLLELAHQRAIHFDSTSGLLNRQGLIKTLSELAKKPDLCANLCLISVNLSKNQARQSDLDPRVRRNMLEKILMRLNETFKQDILCRWSDSVWVVLTNKLNWLNGNSEVIETLSGFEANLNRVFIIENISVRPKLQMGLARVGVHGWHAAELVTHAQSVAHVIESQNLDLIQVQDPLIHELAKRRKTIALGLAKGINNHELVLDFQPVEDLKTGQICSLEALVRWTHPELGKIMPSEFIQIAEDSGLIDALGYWVIESVCTNLLALHQQGHLLWCAINCSAIQLLNPDFLIKTEQIIRKSGLNPEWIEFEVTESAAINHMTRTVNALNQLKNLGASIVLDDFGAGYASLNYLRQLPINILKIDKSFVMDLLEDRNSRMIVKAVIDLAHALGLKVQAEGIETPEQRESLIQMGCDRLQGYWFSKPLSREELSQWLTMKSNKL